MDTVDLLMIGAGPSNIALAVAFEEFGLPHAVGSTVMLESGNTVSWHAGMMFPEAQSQVSFLKDLATLRNPTSSFTFLNFLHRTGRLNDFVNLQTFFPYRREIAAYLQWCVDRLTRVVVRYGAHVESIKPLLDNEGRVERWVVSCRDGRCFSARRIVYGGGRQANVPSLFECIHSARVVHASRLAHVLDNSDASSWRSIAVIGGAQSAAEAYHECVKRFQQAEVRLLIRSIGLSPYGGSKFTNDLYTDVFIDAFHAAPQIARQQTLEAMRDSNYAGVTPSMLETLYRHHYLQRIDGVQRCQIHTHCEISEVEQQNEQVLLKWKSGFEPQRNEGLFDLVVLGTGYRNEWPDLLRTALHPLRVASMSISRAYRVDIPCATGSSLHVLGVNEDTHGISDTLLSVVGARARHVFDDLNADHGLNNSHQSKNSVDFVSADSGNIDLVT